MKHDVTTSLSDVRVPRELEGVALPDHCYRKVEYPKRREYVDCLTCVPSLCNLDVAQTQTEPKRVSIVESQVSQIRALNATVANFLFYSKTNLPF